MTTYAPKICSQRALLPCFEENERSPALTSCPNARMLTDPLHYSITEDFQSPFDATVIHLLDVSGAMIIGKTNCESVTNLAWGNQPSLLDVSSHMAAHPPSGLDL